MARNMEDKLLIPFSPVIPAQNIFVVHTVNMPPDFRRELHLHDFYEIAWLSRGTSTFFSDFEHFSLRQGALAFISPGQVHVMDANWSETEAYVIGFKPDALALYGREVRFVEELPYYDHQSLPVLDVAADTKPLFDNLFATAMARFVAYGNEQDELLAAYLNLILVEARRLYVSAPRYRKPSAAMHLTTEFRKIMERHYRERKRVNEYADMLAVTSNHLVRAVRETTGSTPGRLLEERLALEAKRQLLYTGDTVAEIAYQLAFATPTQFGTWFKKVEGTTPSQFRHHQRTALRLPIRESEL